MLGTKGVGGEKSVFTRRTVTGTYDRKDCFDNGSGTYRERGCAKIGYFRSYEWVARADGLGNGGVGGEKSVFTSRAVLRRPSVRTGTSTTPVWMGSEGIRSVGG